MYFDVYLWELLLDNKPQSPSIHTFKIEDTQFLAYLKAMFVVCEVHVCIFHLAIQRATDCDFMMLLFASDSDDIICLTA